MTLATTRRRLLIGGAMLATAGVSALWTPRRFAQPLSDKQFAALIPGGFGGWTYQGDGGIVLPPPDQLEQTAYDQLLTRTYVGPGGVQVMLVIAYSLVQEGRLLVHRPENCYPASGFTILANDIRDLPVPGAPPVPVRLLDTVRGARHEQVLYWTRVGDRMPTRWSQQRLMMAEDNLRGVLPDGLLFRVSLVSEDVPRAYATLAGFVAALLAAARPAGRTLLIGQR